MFYLLVQCCKLMYREQVQNPEHIFFLERIHESIFFLSHLKLDINISRDLGQAMENVFKQV